MKQFTQPTVELRQWKIFPNARDHPGVPQRTRIPVNAETVEACGGHTAGVLFSRSPHSSIPFVFRWRVCSHSLLLDQSRNHVNSHRCCSVLYINTTFQTKRTAKCSMHLEYIPQSTHEMRRHLIKIVVSSLFLVYFSQRGKKLSTYVVNC